MKLDQEQLARVREAAIRKGLHPMDMVPLDGFILWSALRGQELFAGEIEHLALLLEIQLEADC